MELIILFLTMAIAQNVVLTKFLGICPFIGVSKSLKPAFSMGGAVTFVIFLASLSTKALYDYVLVELDIVYLQTIVFILVIASLVQFLEILIKKFMPALYNAFGVYLPLITTNCAVLGTALLLVGDGHDWMNTIFASLGVGVGFTLAMCLFAGIREKLDLADVPAGFKGVPIALISAAIMAVIFANGLSTII